MYLADNEIHLHWLPWQRSQGRSELYKTLATYLGVAPDRVRIDQIDSASKPRLPAPSSELCFNWSHSGEHALLAVTCGLEVGVDLEQLSRRSNALPLARRFFATSETNLLEACDEACRKQLFLRLWTAKEAVLKCMGEGLSYGLHRVTIGVSADELRLLDLTDSMHEPITWQLRALPTPQSNLLATLAWQGSARRLIHFAKGLRVSQASLFAAACFS